MSPQSRKSNHLSGGRSGGQSQSSLIAAPPDALFDDLLREARELLAVRSPLDAELMVSQLLGTWWGPRSGDARGATDVERLVGEALIAYAGRQGSPAALALLSGIACLGTARQACRAEQAALLLMSRGVRRPAWAERLGAVTVSDCYVKADFYGDTDEVVCVFSYGGGEPHALVTLVDYNAGGMLRDGWVTSHVDKLLAHCARPDGPDGANRFGTLEPGQARRLLKSSLTVTDSSAGPRVSETFAAYHAFIRARIRVLPPSADIADPTELFAGRCGDAAGTASGTVASRPWSRDRRAMLAAEFLASAETDNLSDLGAASRCADRIIDYGCDKDFGRPLRMSPAKVETFLLDWLPRKVVLSAAEQEAIPHVLAAWVRWSARRRRLDDKALGETLDALFNATGAFSLAYHDVAEFGLDAELVAKLLPDGDLEALPRRAFAFSLLRGRHLDVDLADLDPANPTDRRALLAADHDFGAGWLGINRHLDRHVALADRLWRGDPPELWDTAQRLLDAGHDRHAVLHALMGAIEAAGGNPADVVAALRGLGRGDTGADGPGV